jgi:hypothetical protein
MRLAGSRRIATVAISLLVLGAVPMAPSFAMGVPTPPETRTATMEALPEAPASAAADDGPAFTPPLDADVPFSMLGFVLPEGTDELDVRTRDLEGAWSPWTTLEREMADVDGPDPGTSEAVAASAATDATDSTEPLWVGAADAFQVRIAGDLAEVEVALIDTAGLAEGGIARAIRHLGARQAVAPAQAATVRPRIISRTEWGANESLRQGSPSYAAPRFAVLHHTAGSNGYTREQSPAVVRGIYSYHTLTKGWADIGYNILVDQYGQVFEGRAGGIDKGVVGAHAAGFNTGSFGVALIGNHEEVAASAVALDAVAQVVAWKYAVHGIDAAPSRTVTAGTRTINVLAGHRDLASTLCPGRHVHERMGALRTRIAALATVVADPPAPELSSPPVVAPPPPSVAPAPLPPALPGSPVTGDFNGDGRTQAAWFHDGHWSLPIGVSGATQSITFGGRGDLPVVGDWNGDGKDGIGVWRSGRWLLRQTPTAGAPQIDVLFGSATDVPLVGDWNGTRRDGIGTYRDGQWRLRQTASAGLPELSFTYGAAGDVPVVGDWNLSRRDGIGFVRGASWNLRDTATAGSPARTFSFARAEDRRVVGDFTRGGRDTVGVVRGDQWVISTTMPAAPADLVFRFAPVAPPPPSPPPPPPPPVLVPSVASATPVLGDWNGDGRSQPGWFHAGRWYLPIGPSGATRTVAYGRAGDTPVVGDWNGNGRDGIGVRRGGRWLLRQTPTAGAAQVNVVYGSSTDVPVVGDWNGNGRDGIGVFRSGQWRLRQTASAGSPQLTFTYGRKGDVPVVGDWAKRSRDGVGYVRGTRWNLRDTATAGSPARTFSFGLASDRRLVGDLDRDGRDTVGVVRGERWLFSTKMPAGPADWVLRYAPGSATVR